MQYLLTEQEFNSLTPKSVIGLRDAALVMAREKLLAVTDFDCIHNTEGKNYGGYCSECPCNPFNNGDPLSDSGHELWSLVCTLPKNYSQ